MLRRLPSRDKIAAAVCVVLAIAGLLTFSAPLQNREHIRDPNQHAESKSDDVSTAISADDRIADYTLALAIFTGALVVISGIQIYFLRRSDDTARIAANAAKASADALPSIERAHVFLTVLEANFEGAIADAMNYSNPSVIAKPPRIRAPMVKFRFENHGKTAASILEISAGMNHWEKPPAPDDIPLMKRPFQRWSFVIGTNSSSDDDTILDGAMTGAEADMFRGGGLHFYFYGHIVYGDVFGDEHVTAFCWRYSRDHSFGPWGGNKYNYRT